MFLTERSLNFVNGQRIMDIKEKPTKGEETQQRILDAAADLFVENGYAATTTRQITDELGMTRGILYNYYSSKEEIFEAVIKEMHPWLQIIPVVEIATGNSVDEFVENAATLLVQRWDEHPGYTRLHFIELVEFKGQHLSEIFQTVFSQMVDILKEKIQQNAGLTGVPVAALSRSLLGLFFGYLMSDRFSGINLNGNVSQGSFDYFADIYLRGVISEVNASMHDKSKQ